MKQRDSNNCNANQIKGEYDIYFGGTNSIETQTTWNSVTDVL